MNKNTILIIGSAPSYPHGIIDPIFELSELLWKKKLFMPMEVFIPFLDDLMELIEDVLVLLLFLFTHKYGYSLKGSSVLLMKSLKCNINTLFKRIGMVNLCYSYNDGV